MGCNPKSMRRVIAALLMMSAGLLLPEGGMAMGEQKPRPVIVLSCPPDVPQPQALCREMMQALRAASPDGALVRLRQEGERFEPRSGDLEVMLELEALRSDHMSAHLAWRRAVADTLQTGPSVSLDVMDSGLDTVSYTRFVEGMLRVTPQLFEP